MSRNTFAPNFFEVINVSPRKAMIDRVSIVIEVGSLTGLPEDIRDSVFFAVAPSLNEQNGTTPQLFENADSEGSSYGNRIKTKGLPKNRTKQHYFFGGILRSSRANAPVQRMTFTASLNVTRFIQSQTLARSRKDGRVHARQPYALTLAVEPNWWVSDAPLEMDSNIIAGNKSRFEFAEQVPAADHFDVAVSVVRSHIVGRLQEGAVSEGVGFHETYKMVLRELEVYWEFTAPDPIMLVDLITDKLTALSIRSRKTAKRLKPPVVETTRMSRSVMIELTADTQLRVYAKTTDRVRFEVMFSPKAISRIAGSRTTTFMPVMKERVNELIEQATVHGNWILSELKNVVVDHPFPATPDNLRSAIERASPDLATALAITSVLLRTRRIAPDHDPNILAAVRKLRSRRVVEAVRPYLSCYRVTPRYRDALERMRSGI